MDIIIATYGPDGQKFLDDCLQSISRQTCKDYQVYLISSGDFKPAINSSVDVIHKHFLGRLHYPAAVHEGVKLGNSEHILLCNDDIIMNKDLVDRMVNRLTHEPNLIINPLSPCSNGRFYVMPLGFKKRDFQFVFDSNKYSHSDISPHHVDDIIESGGLVPYPVGGKIPVKFCAFFCTAMTRKTWNDVGGIDTALKTGQDDLDFCLRAAEIGIKPVVCFDSFAFHYSGSTADIHLTDEDRKFNVNHFNEKWRSKGISLPIIK